MAIWYRSKSVSLPTSLGPSGRLRALLDQSQLVTSPLLETRSGVPIGAAAYRAIEDEIHISLFDENNVSAVDLDDDGTTKHKKQQRWLAGLPIPFVAATVVTLSTARGLGVVPPMQGLATNHRDRQS